MDRAAKNEYMKAWNARNRERVSAQRRARYVANHEQSTARRRARYAEDPEFRERVANSNRRAYENNKPAAFERAKKWTAKDPERTKLIKRVGMRVAYAVKTGRLIKPLTCEQCGGYRRITAAHESYDRPLDVRWLCWSCHMRWDHKTPKYVVA